MKLFDLLTTEEKIKAKQVKPAAVRNCLFIEVTVEELDQLGDFLLTNKSSDLGADKCVHVLSELMERKRLTQ